MRTGFVAFDCETTGLTDTDTITCIVTQCVVSDTETETRRWHGALGSSIDIGTLQSCVDYMWHFFTHKKYPLVSYNGVNFDFRVMARMLAAYPDYINRLELLALGGEDIMLDFATEFGYFVGMQSFAQGCQLQGKTNTGAWAADKWKNGTPTEQQAVIEYCVADVQVLCDLVQYRAKHDMLHRLTKQNKRSMWMPQAATFRPAHKCITDYTEKPIKCEWLSQPPDIPAMWQWLTFIE